MDKVLSPRDLADALGVSESSVKRWVDDGRIAASRTVGGHRRISRADALAFVRDNGAKVARPELLALPRLTEVDTSPDGLRAVGDQLYAAYVADDQAAARGLLFSAFAAGATMVNLCDGPLRSAFGRLGELWRESEDGILLEHRALENCLHTLGAIATMLPEPAADAPVAVGGAPSPDPYLLPSLAASLVLSEAGMRVVNLGANTPVAVTAAAARRYDASLVWQAVTNPESQDLEPLAAALEAASVTFVVGGQALNVPGYRVPTGAMALFSMADLRDFAVGRFKAQRASSAA
jgi:excisionase family DNA binding protein